LLLLGKFPGLWWLDAVAAMVLGMLIIYVWTMTGKAHVQLLAGRVAEKEQLATLTYLAMNHDARITVVDTVRAYYVGAKVVAEVDIVLPAAMPLQEAHDIGEGLQKEIEKLPYVERAYVHLDTEYAHNERDEHTVLW
jgi:divalent metal cation (Fe/Co/Zn/Cd) transporter